MASEINFHPWKSNVIDYVGKELVSTTTGVKVKVGQDMRGQFIVYVDGVPAETELSNLAASSVLNRIGCKLV